MGVPTGRVQLVGTVVSNNIIGTAATYFASPNNFKNATFGGNAAGINNYIGADGTSGASMTLCRVKISTIPDTTLGYKQHYGMGTQVQASSGGTPGTGSNVIAFLHSALNKPVYPLRWNEFDVIPPTGGLDTPTAQFPTTGRSFAISNPSNFMVINSARFEVDALFTGTPNVCPLPPILSSGGVHNPTGTVGPVQFSSRTTSGTLYYTIGGSSAAQTVKTNGTAVTNGSQAFIRVSGTGGLVNVVTFDPNCTTTLSDVQTYTFNNYSYAPGDVTYDTDGNQLMIHACSMLNANGRWYMYGQCCPTGNTNLTTAGQDSWWYDGVHCYSSDFPDGRNGWRWHGRMIDNFNGFSVQRPKVLYCKQTNQYVMLAHWCNNISYTINLLLIAVSGTPDGPFTTIGTFNPDGANDATIFGVKDMTAFYDASGTPWLYYTTATNLGTNGKVVCSQLAPDLMTTTGNIATVAPSTGQFEGLAALISGSEVYLLYGSPTFYDSQGLASTQDINVTVGATGTYTLTCYTGPTTSATTISISVNATTTVVAAAINVALTTLLGGTATVTGTAGSFYEVAIAGGTAPYQKMVVNSAGITAGSVTVGGHSSNINIQVQAGGSVSAAAAATPVELMSPNPNGGVFNLQCSDIFLYGSQAALMGDFWLNSTDPIYGANRQYDLYNSTIQTLPLTASALTLSVATSASGWNLSSVTPPNPDADVIEVGPLIVPGNQVIVMV